MRKNDRDVKKIIGYLDQILGMSFVQNFPIYKEQFESLRDRVSDKSFRIAVVGEFSSGKSTFVNALIGKDVLTHGARETTATITEIENNPDKYSANSFDVYFENGSVEKGINLNKEKIIEYTTTHSKEYKVVEKINKVVIKSHILDTNIPMVFVDTPGLNGVADHHRERTYEQIQRAHACIYLIPMRGLSDTDIQFTKEISKYQENIIFVQNFIDQLEEEGESVEAKLAEQRSLLESKGNLKKIRLVAVSARNALLAEDKELFYNSEERKKQINPETIFELSRWKEVMKTIYQLINEKDKSRIDEAVCVMLEKVIDLEKGLKDRWEVEALLLENSPEKKRVLEAIQKKLERLKDRRENQKTELLEFVRAEGKSLEKALKNDSAEEIDKALEKNKSRIDQIDDFWAVDIYEEEIKEDIEKENKDIQYHVNLWMKQGCENILCKSISKIETEYNTVKVKTSGGRFVAKDMDGYHEEYHFRKENNEIIEEEGLLKKEKREKEWLQDKLSKNEREIEEKKKEQEEAERKRIKNERNCREKQNQLGEQPSIELVQKEETYEEKRNPIAQLFLGNKIATRMVEVEDSSKLEKWMKERKQLEEEFEKEDRKFERQIKRLQSEIESLQMEKSRMEEREAYYSRSIESKESRIKVIREEIDIKRKKARREYLQKRKEEFRESVEAYFKGLDDSVKREIGSAVSSNIDDLCMHVEKEYEDSCEAKEREMEKLLSTNQFKLDLSVKEDMQIVGLIRSSLEKYGRRS
ncbi:MAG: dynamin family protein [Lachnospiraceae bacterium]|jgi:hypothetical protein|nr:dynamin family protein [Lachnospiraceae bacterium]